jgi:hypothetical protein
MGTRIDNVEGVGHNPALRPVSPYCEAFTTNTTSLSDMERHERKIYQPGYTPAAIRENIQRILRDSNPRQHMVDFPECDIPPPHRDVRTHRLLTDLLEQRNSLDQEFQVAIASIAADGTTLNPSTKYKDEYAIRDEQYNRVNRRMYKVYAASTYLIHDGNFSSYCRPALRHLPKATAYKLATFKEKLQSQEHVNPPYTTVQKPASTKTQPVFTAPRPSYSDVVISRPLQPRPQWMRSQEPLVSDAEADRNWRQGNETMFGQTELTTPQLEKKINDLQYELYLRTESAARAHPDWAPPSKPLVSRTFRQGNRTYTADKKTQIIVGPISIREKVFCTAKIWFAR